MKQNSQPVFVFGKQYGPVLQKKHLKAFTEKETLTRVETR